MMAIPQIMSRIWDGDPNEYFTASDMRRVQENANILARYAGVPESQFIPTDRASQFRYDEAQKIENLSKKIAAKLGITIPTEDHWNYNRVISYVDFERWEAGLWESYKALGGVGDRIPSDKFLHVVNAVLFSGDWRGQGPYSQDIDLPAIREGMDAAVFVSETATAAERQDEFNALLQMVPLDNHKARVYAMGLKPIQNIPIKVTTKAWEMDRQIILRAGNWQGSGPWTQTIDLGNQVSSAVIGSDERNNPEQLRQLANAVIGVSGIKGSMVTLRAVGIKPTKDINATVLWVNSEAA